MRDVDQNSGKDLLPLKKSSDDDAFRTNPSGVNNRDPTTRTGLSGIRIVEEDDAIPSRRPLKRMSSPEKWEAKQLFAAGVMDVRENPMYDVDGDGFLYQEEGAEEELEIELNEDEPIYARTEPILSRHVTVKIFKNQEGSLSQAATLDLLS
ncbi:putative pre-mRNA-splicing factor ATP-dependent RNA helicase DEAH5 [Camellia lanceoleosa]|nr:putative pre-mRNA-splicing factor ATP-dependent RNA helicase DEAH5 [Camellia lanceoleosa]